MCLQCECNSISWEEIVPGWALQRARKDYADDWKSGEWGLVRCNDPDFVWSGELLKDPYFEMGDEEINSKPELEAKDNKFSVCSHEFWELLRLTPNLGHELVEACKQAGYVQEKHGPVAHWLMHKMACLVESKKPIDNDSNVVDNF